MNELFLIIGLGNPGTRYENTRHNVGFDAIDFLAHKYNIRVAKLGYKALYGEGEIDNIRVMLVKPQTFMNLSGDSIRDIVQWYKIPMNRVIVIYDDIDLKPGKIRVRSKGSSGTHNGMKSIIYQLQSQDFPRVRIGIGRAPEKWDLADFVLSKFSKEERDMIDESVANASEAAVAIAKDGVEQAMNKYNS